MLTRREFIKLVLTSAAGFSLLDALTPHLAEAFAGKKTMPIIWLETNTCGGDILSLLNSLTPTLKELLFSEDGLLFSNTLSAAEGNIAIRQLFDSAREHRNNFILAVEGTIPTKANGRYAVIGHRSNGKPVTALEAVQTLAPMAKYVVAAGTCSSFGGPYAAKPNPSGSKPLYKVIKEPVVNVSGCPIHPEWMTGTLTHLMLYGFPQLDVHRRPTIFYGKLIHDLCPRRQYFDNGIFAKKPGDTQCLFKIGCKGPSTFADCPTRQWASFHYNWPIGANTPCIGCTSPEFPDGDSPFFERLPGIKAPFGLTVSANTLGVATGAVTAAGLGAHLVGNIATGRLKNNIVKGRQDIEEEKDLKESGMNKKQNQQSKDNKNNKKNNQSDNNEETVNLQLTREEAAKLLDMLADTEKKEPKKWPDKTEIQLRRAFKHDGKLPGKGKRRTLTKGVWAWAKSRFGIGLGEKDE